MTGGGVLATIARMVRIVHCAACGATLRTSAPPVVDAVYVCAASPKCERQAQPGAGVERECAEQRAA